MKKISVAKFQELNKILKTNIEDFDKGVAYVATLFDIDVTDVSKMKPKKFDLACKLIVETFEKVTNNKTGSPVKIFRLNGSVYKVFYNLKTAPFNAGRYVEIATFTRDPIENINKTMASIVIPVRKKWFRWVPVKNPKRYTHEKISLDFLTADINAVWDSFVFFCQNSKTLTGSFRPYLTVRNWTTNNPGGSKRILINISGGFIRRRWLAN